MNSAGLSEVVSKKAMEYDEGELVEDFNEVANVNVYSEAAVLGSVMEMTIILWVMVEFHGPSIL